MSIMWNRQQLKEDSRLLLKMNYWPFVLVAFVYTLVSGGAGGSSGANGYRTARKHYDLDQGYDFMDGTVLGIAALTVVTVALVVGLIAIFVDIFVFNPLKVGCKRYMTIARATKPELGEMAFAFRNCYGNVVKTMFLVDLYTFLWTLLFVIPGIIKSYEYRMVPYLMAEYPDMASSEAFRISREMMTGNKWDAFVLDLSFLGWYLLGAITFGILDLFYVSPYVMLTDSALYLMLKQGNSSLGYAGQSGYYQNNGSNGYDGYNGY